MNLPPPVVPAPPDVTHDTVVAYMQQHHISFDQYAIQIIPNSYPGRYVFVLHTINGAPFQSIDPQGQYAIYLGTGGAPVTVPIPAYSSSQHTPYSERPPHERIWGPPSPPHNAASFIPQQQFNPQFYPNTIPKGFIPQPQFNPQLPPNYYTQGEQQPPNDEGYIPQKFDNELPPNYPQTHIIGLHGPIKTRNNLPRPKEVYHIIDGYPPLPLAAQSHAAGKPFDQADLNAFCKKHGYDPSKCTFTLNPETNGSLACVVPRKIFTAGATYDLKGYDKSRKHAFYEGPHGARPPGQALSLVYYSQWSPPETPHSSTSGEYAMATALPRVAPFSNDLDQATIQCTQTFARKHMQSELVIQDASNIFCIRDTTQMAQGRRPCVDRKSVV